MFSLIVIHRVLISFHTKKSAISVQLFGQLYINSNISYRLYFTNSAVLNYLSLKYPRFTPSDFNDIGIKKFEFMAAKTQFLCGRERCVEKVSCREFTEDKTNIAVY